MKHPLLIFTLLGLLLSISDAGEKQSLSAGAIGREIEIIGELGVAVGKVVVIEGRKTSKGPIRDLFEVSAVDGKVAKAVVTVKGVEDWPDGTEAKLKGFEVGTLKFLTLEMTNNGKNDPRWKGPYQQLFLSFEVKNIVSPAKLVLKK